MRRRQLYQEPEVDAAIAGAMSGTPSRKEAELLNRTCFECRKVFKSEQSLKIHKGRWCKK